jgi:alkanesulfonate monooxygenase SsuD/methylene tetrahydromethanopterin reductase-like flavin-dependent oxidoreductase (luciferase family)
MRISLFSVSDHHPAGPRSVAELYKEILAQAEFADKLGYDTFWLAEHHFHPYGAVPNPAVMLAAIAQRTTCLKLGTAVSILPFHHPLTLAENYAMTDILSNGRLVYGVGSGYLAHEFAGYGIDSAEKRDRFDESLVIIKRLFSGERVTVHGRFYKIDDVEINVLPVQLKVPFYVAILRKEAAYFVGQRGHNMLCIPYASLDHFNDIAALVAEYNRGYFESGLPATAKSIAVTLHTHVAESDQKARENAEEAFNLYVRTRLYAKRSTYDDAMKNGLHLFGSIETIANKLIALHRMGVDHVVSLQNFGLMPHTLVQQSMKRLMQEVMPPVVRSIGHSI